MGASSTTTSPKRRLPGPFLLVLGLLAMLWILFFDSHSLVKRWHWHQEYARLAEENAQLQQEISVLQERLAEPISDDVIEKIAREQYGMRRPEETVYRVSKQP